MTRRLTLALAALLAPMLALAAPPGPYRADYEVLRNGSVLGRAEVELARDGDAWTLTSHTRGTEGLAALAGADIRERSTLRWRDGRPETTGYRYEQKTAFNTRKRSLEVDAAKGQIVSRDRKDSRTLTWTPGVLDRQLVALALAQDLAAGKREVEYQVAERRAVEPQRYRLAGTESVQVPDGRIDAARVERIREGDSGRTTTIWLDPARDYLPVRTVQREKDGETIEMRLVGVEPAG
ncbi:DUF3108 domain-containing protein [Coralloluteibacterium stylophorae]|uniref:DUF3108 domain-containing protein n=1 Tax=Coralloluteibacterium stylophorae TaxID=1776034 RepID=A0A8J8B0K8_9GAMM|nr:DUF3108 domain-containing protein [Coralloluteibacterium stylophorae]MBS7456732.1 DUF3108 domain-containing protein [Coralloluteibacterium stylophorae]